MLACAVPFTEQINFLKVMAREVAALAFVLVRVEADLQYDHYTRLTVRFAELTRCQSSGRAPVRSRNRVDIRQMRTKQSLSSRHFLKPESPDLLFTMFGQLESCLTLQAKAARALEVGAAGETYATMETQPFPTHPASSSTTPLPKNGAVISSHFQQAPEAHLSETSA